VLWHDRAPPLGCGVAECDLDRCTMAADGPSDVEGDQQASADHPKNDKNRGW
jgi:hypothetical protein